MKLFIKHRVFAWGDKYDVYDESGEARYYVESELFTFGHQTMSMTNAPDGRLASYRNGC